MNQVRSWSPKACILETETEDELHRNPQHTSWCSKENKAGWGKEGASLEPVVRAKRDYRAATIHNSAALRQEDEPGVSEEQNTSRAGTVSKQGGLVWAAICPSEYNVMKSERPVAVLILGF